MPVKKQFKKTNGVRLNMELGCNLFVQFNNRKDIFPSYLLGMKTDAFLIIKTPTIIGNDNLMAEGNGVTLRFSHLGEVFRFKTTVLRSLKRPFKVTFLSYPQRIEKIELRNSSRAFCYIPASLSHGDLQVEGVVTDISRGGSQFTTKEIKDSTPRQIKIGDNIGLYFTVLGIEGVSEIKGKIKKMTQDIRCHSFGIGFEPIDMDIADKIDAYVKRVNEYSGRYS